MCVLITSDWVGLQLSEPFMGIFVSFEKWSDLNICKQWFTTIFCCVSLKQMDEWIIFGGFYVIPLLVKSYMYKMDWGVYIYIYIFIYIRTWWSLHIWPMTGMTIPVWMMISVRDLPMITGNVTLSLFLGKILRRCQRWPIGDCFCGHKKSLSSISISSEWLFAVRTAVWSNMHSTVPSYRLTGLLLFTTFLLMCSFGKCYITLWLLTSFDMGLFLFLHLSTKVIYTVALVLLLHTQDLSHSSLLLFQLQEHSYCMSICWTEHSDNSTVYESTVYQSQQLKRIIMFATKIIGRTQNKHSNLYCQAVER